MDPYQQPWYHGRVSRQEAEALLEIEGYVDGLFLLRDSLSMTGEYALSVCHKGKPYHYQISRHKDKVAIEDGKRFDGPIELVEFHRTRCEGLLTMLLKPCNRRPGVHPTGYRFISHDEMQKAMKDAAIQLGYEPQQVQLAISYRRAAFEQLVGGILHKTQVWFHGSINRAEAETRMKKFGVKNGLFLDNIYHYLMERNSDGLLSIQKGRKFENIIQAVDHYSRNSDGLLAMLVDPCLKSGKAVSQVQHPGPKRIEETGLVVTSELGHGSFGKVMRGTYRYPNGSSVEVAVKCLKQGEAPNPKHEIMREADLMSQLDHENIVRLIGICATEPMMIVMELAPLGPLNKYLKKQGQSVPVEAIANFVQQIATGMAYLESVRFVHRDLAARNVLVVREDFVKISDFGMSRALGAGSEYYRPDTPGRWPLKWYAPECIYFTKFDSKSDVWSFGVTMWEAFSYGAKPYQGKKGQDILQMIEDNQRLDRPQACSPPVYQLMMQCWTYNADGRPSFAQLRDQLKKLNSKTLPPRVPPRV